MDVIFVMREILNISNSVIGEPALPDFSLSGEHCAQGVRRSTFDELDHMFEGYVLSRSK